MRLKGPIDLPAVIDLHVHLRQDPAMMALALKAAGDGGTQTLYVMPNLTPPLISVSEVSHYAQRLHDLAIAIPGCSELDFLFTLYLHPSLTADAVREAASLKNASGGRLIHGIKAYPAGVTTNSSAGVTDFSAFYPLFSVMEAVDMILNIHGETPGVGVLNAECSFLPTLEEIHSRFPKLRIVLEHVSSQVALELVQRLGDNVRCTITAHHLLITMEDWEGMEDATSSTKHIASNAHNWCKPAAKTMTDRMALIQAIVRGGNTVMFGSDSAPHPTSAKKQAPPAAGCFTQGWTASLVLQALEEGVQRSWIQMDEVTRDVVEGFLGGRARSWLRQHWKAPDAQWIRLARKGEKTPGTLIAEREGNTAEVTPFRAGKECWSIEKLSAAGRSGTPEMLSWEP